MERVDFGTTGVRVSRLALGTMTFGREADVEASRALFARARDAGIDLFDCADVYAKGKSEEILGELVRGCRDQIVLTSKAYFPTGPGDNDRGSSRYHLVRAVEASLRRLGTDRIDVFFLHRFDDRTPLEETLRGVELLVREGKILYPAASNFAAWQVARALGVAEARGWAKLAAIQPMYSLVKRQAEVELLPMARAEGLAVMPYGPVAGGLLSGKYGVNRKPDGGRLVDDAMYRARYGGDFVYQVADRFAALAREAGVHPVTLAVGWVMQHPAVTSTLIGARNVEQLEPSLAAASFVVGSELYAQVSSLVPAPPPATDRNEESSADDYASALRRA
ncbi:MAG: aldo/keto reductase [Sandaracinaceae bacterium]|nr:aldo/keto reductase [Sandaracinaceae bacterium]